MNESVDFLTFTEYFSLWNTSKLSKFGSAALKTGSNRLIEFILWMTMTRWLKIFKDYIWFEDHRWIESQGQYLLNAYIYEHLRPGCPEYSQSYLSVFRTLSRNGICSPEGATISAERKVVITKLLIIWTYKWQSQCNRIPVVSEILYYCLKII